MILLAKKISLITIRQYLEQYAIQLLFIDVNLFVAFSADLRREKRKHL